MRFTAFRGWPLYTFLFFLAFSTWQAVAAAQEGPIKPASPQQAPQQAPLPPQPAPPPPAQSQGPGYTISVMVPVVNVNVVVTDDNGNYLNHLDKENFRITEDGAPQVISNFATGEAPVTVAVIVEYSQLGYGWFLYDAVKWADVFLHQMKPQDWVALVSFNIRTNVEVDFTHSPQEIENGLRTLIFPPFSESNVYDAVAETADRMRDVKGQKAILVLASGHDTFSRLTFDKTMAKLKESDNPIYCVGVAEQYALQQESQGGLGTLTLSHIAAQQQLKAFSDLTGGRAFFPRFDGEIPDIMKDIAASLRYGYSLAYTPSNQATDGKYRKIKVEVVDPDGKPLVMTDPKGKKIKYQVHFRQGYTAPKNSIIN